MSLTLSRAGALAFLIASFAFQAEAQNCSNANYSGTFFYLQQGAYSMSGTVTPYASIGKVIADGNGNLKGTATEHNGLNVIDTASFTGTYSVGSNCSGTETITTTPQAGSPFTVTSAFQILEGGAGGVAVTTGADDVISTVAYPAETVCNTTTLKGTYGGSFSGFAFSPGDFGALEGSVTFDGNGNATGSTGSGNDLILGGTPLSGGGTYTLNSDCTGRVTVAGEPEVIALARGGRVLFLEAVPGEDPAVGVLESVYSGAIIPHIALNGGWNTNMVLVNNGSSTANATLNFLAGDGTPWQITVLPEGVADPVNATTLNVSIPANARIIVQTVGNPSAAVVGGWARVSSNLPITAYAVFGWPVNGNASAGLTSAVSYACGGGNSETSPFDNTNGQYFGVAVVNLAGEPATITATVYDPNGAQQGQAAVSSSPLPAGGHTQFLLSSLIPATSGTGAVPTGTVTLTSSVGNLAITPLQFNSNATFTSVPVPCQ